MQTDIYKLSFPVTYKILSAQIIILDRFVFGGSPYLYDSQIFPVTVKPFLKVFYFCVAEPCFHEHMSFGSRTYVHRGWEHMFVSPGTYVRFLASIFRIVVCHFN